MPNSIDIQVVPKNVATRPLVSGIVASQMRPRRADRAMMLSGVAQRSGRSLSMLECRGAAADHPVSVSCLEGEYLTCVIARVV